jgi:hypothetical protein
MEGEGLDQLGGDFSQDSLAFNGLPDFPHSLAFEFPVLSLARSIQHILDVCQNFIRL